MQTSDRSIRPSRSTNPNRVRSLIGMLSRWRNQTQFNRPDGAGYEFIADTVLALDGKNPQVASGFAPLSAPGARWRAAGAKRRRRHCPGSRRRPICRPTSTTSLAARSGTAEHGSGDMKRRRQWQWIWKSAIAGLCGSVAHFLLLYFKSVTGILPGFQPYHSLQSVLSAWTGGNVNPLVPWALSFLNGLTIVGFAFGRSYSHLPGDKRDNFRKPLSRNMVKRERRA